MIEPFKPITREEAASILRISLTTLDAMIADEVFPPPRQLGDCRKLYWHPDTFYGTLHRRLWVDPASIVLSAPVSVEATCESLQRNADAHSEAVAAGGNSATATPPSLHRRRDALTRQAERLKRLNR